MSARLKVLYLTHHGPLPASSGGRLRDAALIPRLAELVDLEVWAVSRTPDEDLAALADYRHARAWRVYADEGPRRSYPSRDSRALAIDLAGRMDGPEPFDVIHVEGHYLFHLVPDHHRGCVVVAEHNVESHLLAQRARIAGWTDETAADLMAVIENEEAVWRAAPLLITLSPEDRVRIAERVPMARVEVSGNGSDHLPSLCARSAHEVDPERPTIGFLANYLYSPNRDALDWLIDDLFPAISVRLPGSRLLLAGSNLAQALAGRRLPKGVVAHGWFDDLEAFWKATDVVVCPLRIGGGVKVKMMEALRSGALTVSTSIGMEGLPPSACNAVMRADTADEFVQATVRLCTDIPLRVMKQVRLARVQDGLPTWEEAATTLFRHWLSVSQPVLGGTRG